ncbi:hypothetical protein [Christiangramia portivictoriae]|uniref:hypothetical protein n=1 Tax=Christiangramia portivictoriae TaxID=326069 RepID=UPI00040A92E8|nr:hypothetical protein [Christiangramia portivictoriae]
MLYLDHAHAYMDFLQLEYTKKNQQTLSNISIDNYKRVIFALISVLQIKRVIKNNIFIKIPKLKSRPTKHKPFTKEELLRVTPAIRKKDPYLINVVAFIFYGLLRPTEIVRLQVKNINTNDCTLGVQTKTEDFAYARIIDKCGRL